MASMFGEISFDQPCADDDHFVKLAQSSKNWKPDEGFRPASGRVLIAQGLDAAEAPVRALKNVIATGCSPPRRQHIAQIFAELTEELNYS
jgi:hypothetical protein